MRPRSLRGLTCKPSAGRVTIAVVGMEGGDAVHLPPSLETLDRPRVFTYDQPQILLANPPAWWVDMFVLARMNHAEAVTRMLCWARRRWPGALQVVVASPSPAVESAARRQGAMFFHSPLNENDWQSLLAGAKQLNTAMTSSEIF